jgi:hypothetical protein
MRHRFLDRLARRLGGELRGGFVWRFLQQWELER